MNSYGILNLQGWDVEELMRYDLMFIKRRSSIGCTDANANYNSDATYNDGSFGQNNGDSYGLLTSIIPLSGTSSEPVFETFREVNRERTWVVRISSRSH